MFHSLPHDEALGAGAAGPGKSWCLLMDPLAQILSEQDRWKGVLQPDGTRRKHAYPIKKGMSEGWTLHLRRTYPMLEDTMLRAARVFPNIDSGIDYDGEHRTWVFSSGYRYQFGHCKDPGDWNQYFSKAFTEIIFDEVIQFDYEQYAQITSRLRSGDPVLSRMLKVRSATNPTIDRSNMENIMLRDPMWVRKYFIDPAPKGFVTLEKHLVSPRDGRKIIRTRIYLPATLYDNPNEEFVRIYEGTLLDKPKHIREALLYGNWDYTAGAYFDGWDPRVHVCKAFRIPDDWLRFRSLDWGFKSPGCVHWWAMDHEGDIVCEREMTYRDKSATMVAHDIKEIEKDLGLWNMRENCSQITGPADTQLWEKRDQSYSKADEMARCGVRWVPADKKSRARNGELLQGRIRDHVKFGGNPGIQFFENCVMAVRTIPRIISDPVDPGTPMDTNDDHWADSCMYAAAYAARGRKGIPTRREESTPDHEDGATEMRGQYGYGDMWQ